MASQAHIGHATSLWHPGNAKYIFGVRGSADEGSIHIISLDTTAAYLRRAAKVVRGVASRGGLILFVGTRAQQSRIDVRAAQLAGGCHLFNKWTPGSITNGQQILGRCRKRVVDENDQEVLGFQDQLDLKSSLKPDLVICLNPLENYILLHECAIHNIPTIGIVDTDVNPTWVTYPIPANDDSLRAVQVICGVLGRAGEQGQKERMQQARRGHVASLPGHGLEPPTEGQAEKEAEAKQREMAAQEAMEVVEEDGQIVMEEPLMLEGQEAVVEEADADENVEDRLYGQRGDQDGEGDLMDLISGEIANGGDQQLSSEGDETYARDRPLSAEEMARVPAEQELVDDLAEPADDGKSTR